MALYLCWCHRHTFEKQNKGATREQCCVTPKVLVAAVQLEIEGKNKCITALPMGKAFWVLLLLADYNYAKVKQEWG